MRPGGSRQKGAWRQSGGQRTVVKWPGASGGRASCPPQRRSKACKMHALRTPGSPRHRELPPPQPGRGWSTRDASVWWGGPGQRDATACMGASWLARDPGACGGRPMPAGDGRACRGAFRPSRRGLAEHRWGDMMIGAPKWRNWHTRRIQNPFPARGCGFDSHLRQ
jgi:hypothetical protein